MWPFLQKKLDEREQFFLKIGLLSVAVHIFVGFFLFVFYQGTSNFVLNVYGHIPNDVVVRLMPMVRSTGALKNLAKMQSIGAGVPVSKWG